MIRSDLFHRSIKVRVTLFTLIIFLGSLWSLTWYASHLLRVDMERALSDRQFSSVSLLAESLNTQLAERIDLLALVGAEITPKVLANPIDSKQLLKQRPVLQRLFREGVFLVRADGNVLAAVGSQSQAQFEDLIGTDFVQAALKEGRIIVGKRMLGEYLQYPNLGIAVPVIDDRGNILGALAGIFNLRQLGILDEFARSNYGKEGGYLLVDARHRLVITATDPRALQVPIPPVGVSPVLDRFLTGYDGTLRFVNPRGQDVLSSTKKVRLLGGYISMQLPVDEAFAPIRQAEKKMVLVSFLLTLLMSALSWWMLHRQLSPLTETAQTLKSLTQEERQLVHVLPVATRDEIGDLLTSFNHLLAQLTQRAAELQRSQDELRTSHERMRSIMDATPVPMITRDQSGKLSAPNRAFVQLLGYTEHDIPTDQAWWPLAYPDPDYRAQVISQFRQNISAAQRCGARMASLEVSITCKDLVQRTFICGATPLVGSASGEMLVVFFDISDRKRMEEDMRHLALHDPLTQLPNRRLLQDRVDQAIASSKRSGHYAALIFIDLDNFKPLNDAHGHAVGDLLLIDVARRLESSVRASDTVARIGGDEFVVLLNTLDKDRAASKMQASLIAQKILAALSAPYALRASGHDKTTLTHHCSASIGVTLFVGQEAESDAVLKRADQAMYMAKDAGRGTICFTD